MKIFVIGKTHSGKTPVAERLSKIMKYKLIYAGEWVKIHFLKKCDSLEEYIDKTSKYTVEKLREDFTFSLHYIRKKINNSDSYIIDGERNPYDFINLFDPSIDIVICISCRTGSKFKLRYEYGINVISIYLKWLLKNDFIKDFQYRQYQFDCLYNSQKKNLSWNSVEENIDNICRLTKLDVKNLL